LTTLQLRFHERVGYQEHRPPHSHSCAIVPPQGCNTHCRFAAWPTSWNTTMYGYHSSYPFQLPGTASILYCSYHADHNFKNEPFIFHASMDITIRTLFGSLEPPGIPYRSYHADHDFKKELMGTSSHHNTYLCDSISSQTSGYRYLFSLVPTLVFQMHVPTLSVLTVLAVMATAIPVVYLAERDNPSTPSANEAVPSADTFKDYGSYGAYSTYGTYGAAVDKGAAAVAAIVERGGEEIVESGARDMAGRDELDRNEEMERERQRHNQGRDRSVADLDHSMGKADMGVGSENQHQKREITTAMSEMSNDKMDIEVDKNMNTDIRQRDSDTANKVLPYNWYGAYTPYETYGKYGDGVDQEAAKKGMADRMADKAPVGPAGEKV
ncbi:uncharacterized protein BDR25DRAFT_383401, partial [Lindgomyces ingoldianus]